MLKRAMHKPTPEDLELLKKNKFREPNFPYVVFKGNFYEVLDEKKATSDELQAAADAGHPNRRKFESIAVFNVKGVHNRFDILETRYMKPKGFQVVTWGGFPEETSEIAKSLRDGPDKPSPWKVLDGKLKAHMTGEVIKGEKIRALEAKVAELEADAKTKTKLNK